MCVIQNAGAQHKRITVIVQNAYNAWIRHIGYDMNVCMYACIFLASTVIHLSWLFIHSAHAKHVMSDNITYIVLYAKLIIYGNRVVVHAK
jgi:hypothetical protein